MGPYCTHFILFSDSCFSYSTISQGNLSQSSHIVLIILFIDYIILYMWIQSNLFNHYCVEIFASSEQWVFEYMSLYPIIMLVLWFLSALKGNSNFPLELSAPTTWSEAKRPHATSKSIPSPTLVKSKLSLQTTLNLPRVFYLHHQEHKGFEWDIRSWVVDTGEQSS